MSIDIHAVKLGLVPARRGFFSDDLAAKMRKQTIEAMKKLGIKLVVPSEDETCIGCIETIAEADFCADLFRRNDVQGIVINAVNFGDEQAAAWVVRKSRLDVPVLVVGCQEEQMLTMNTDRRDAFCGLLSIGEALRQIGAKYTVARRPICFPSDPSFNEDLRRFIGICRVVNGIRNARYGQLGARPDAFWTCRYDEKSLQGLGPTAVVLDLSEVIGALTKMSDDDPDVKTTLDSINNYANTSKLTDLSLLKIAKLEVFVKRWKQENNIDAFAIQCWTSIQNNYGICTCTTMSRLGDIGIPCACEADILGAMSMHACQLASGTPAALADWNNLHNDDDELVNLWHCGVMPKSFSKTPITLAEHGVLVPAGVSTPDEAGGVAESIAAESPVTLTRITQDRGKWKAVIAEGDIEDNEACTFGAYGWCRIPNLDRLYRDVLMNHFPHHVAMTQSYVGDVLWEAFGNYLDLNVYHATQETPGLYTPGASSHFAVNPGTRSLVSV